MFIFIMALGVGRIFHWNELIIVFSLEKYCSASRLYSASNRPEDYE